MTDLLPCPFCGGVPVVNKSILAAKWRVTCQTCGATSAWLGQVMDCPTHPAIRISAVWNTRAPSGWQDIATAPKDPKKAMLLYMGRDVAIGKWSMESHAKRPRPCWISSKGAYGLFGISWDRSNQPTHWMPLPEPPK